MTSGKLRPRRPKAMPNCKRALSRLNHSSIYKILNIISIFICSLCIAAEAKQSIVEHPKNTTAHLGDTIVLHCRVENQKGTLQWVKNGFGLGTTRDLPLIDRYNMVGKLTLGEYHLQIRNVSVEDEDMYECQLSPTDTDPIQISKVAKLNVIAEPSKPDIIGMIPAINRDLPLIIEATEESAITLSCQSTHGRPAAQLTWAITVDKNANEVISYIFPNNESVVVQKANVIGRKHSQEKNRAYSKIERHYYGKIIETEDIDKEGFHTITSNITFIPTKAENMKFLACLATHDAYAIHKDKLQKSTTIGLDVSYRPKVRVELDKDNSSLMDGGRAVFRCFVDARPSRDVTVKWSWSAGEKRLSILDQHNAMVNGLQLKDSGANVTCTAANIIGGESASLTLDIPYGPRFLSSSQTRIVDLGETVTFTCAASGNPAPEIRWYRHNNADFIATGVNYTISDVQDIDGGDYRCVAIVSGFESKTLEHHLYLKGPPVVYLNPMFKAESNNAMILSCEVSLFPENSLFYLIQTRTFPLKITWFYNEKSLIDTKIKLMDTVRNGALIEEKKSTANKRIRLMNIARQFGVESQLMTLPFYPTDYGTYNCVAHNEYGAAHDERNIFLQTTWQKIVEYWEILPPSYRIAVPVGLIFMILFTLLICCCMCCHGERKSLAKKHNRSCCCCCLLHRGFCYATTSTSSSYDHNNTDDVIVKCEAMDDTQFYPELYDYMAVPQNNPDLDYLPPSAIAYSNATYNNQSLSGHSSVSPYQSRNAHQTFIGATNYEPISRDDGQYVSSTYNVPTFLNNGTQLETLMEVTTPDTDAEAIGNFNNDFNAVESRVQMQQGKQLQDRPISRVSTHV